VTKREQQRIIKQNRRKMFLEAWEERKKKGVSLSAFCRDCGLCRSTFICWLNAARSPVPRKPICRVDPALKVKAIEIYMLHKGAWGGDRIARALDHRINSGTVRTAIKPYRGQWGARGKIRR
jgi:hypothetical protein